MFAVTLQHTEGDSAAELHPSSRSEEHKSLDAERLLEDTDELPELVCGWYDTVEGDC